MVDIGCTYEVVVFLFEVSCLSLSLLDKEILFPPLSSQLKVQLLKKMPIKYKARDENLDSKFYHREQSVKITLSDDDHDHEMMATAKLVMGSNRVLK